MPRYEIPFKNGPVLLTLQDVAMMASTVNLAAPLGGVEPVETIFAVCAEAAYDAPQAQSDGMELHHVVARDVIQAIIDRTPSPATVVELTRILREGGVEVPEVTFD